MSPWVVGIIGGSGLYDIEGLNEPEWRTIESAFGTPSDALLFGRLAGVSVVFLPRHGRAHRLGPSDIDARANIEALSAPAAPISSQSARSDRCARPSRQGLL